mmetsp:Transcript_11762/g.25831  ORF Transcript_11762/g.25831 Transcript_11762/m.25831 type:complete len:338 (-) Transcript_11762:8-1021(-)
MFIPFPSSALLLALRPYMSFIGQATSGAGELLRTFFTLTAVDIIVTVSAVCLLLVAWLYVAIVLFAGLRHLNTLKRSIIRLFIRSSSIYSCASLPISTMSFSLDCHLPPILFGSVDKVVTIWYFNTFSTKFEYVPEHNRYQVRQSDSSESPSSSKATKFLSSPALSDRSIAQVRSTPCIEQVPKQGASKQVRWSEPTYIPYPTKEAILKHLPNWPEELRVDSSNASDDVDHILSCVREWVSHVETRCGCLSDELHSLLKNVNTYRTTCERDVFIEACKAWKEECIKSARQQVLEAPSIMPSTRKSVIKNSMNRDANRRQSFKSGIDYESKRRQRSIY